MAKTRDELLALLNAPEALENLKELIKTEPAPVIGRDVNNHIHTTYSFSPYSPTAAVWFSHAAGLCTCGLMDHDSIAGAEEFLAAADTVGIAATIGMECRASMKGTPYEHKKLNNPDQDGVAYMALHGVPHNRAHELNEFYAPYRAKRNERNKKMVDAVNNMMSKYGVTIDFEKDVLPLSNFAKGGSVTERHLSSALAYKMLEVIGSGETLVKFIRNELQLPLSDKIAGLLTDESNPYKMYDLLGWIKSQLISRFYVDADEELPLISDLIALANKIGAICAYAYLGDVGDSVTGDKRAQKFEDDYLDELVEYLKSIGLRAITYMPPRNTPAQLKRIRGLCDKYGLLQISGVDINQPRQKFVCEEQRAPEFSNLYDATWALIAHERRATENPDDGFFSIKSITRWPDLNDRIAAFSKFGRDL